MARRCKCRVGDRHLAENLLGEARMPDVDGFRNRAEDGEVAAGIDEPLRLTVLSQNIDRAIDGEPLAIPPRSILTPG